EETGRIGREGRQQGRGIIARGEKQRREEWRQRRIEIKVIPFKDGTDRGGENDAPFLLGYPRARVACRRNRCHFFLPKPQFRAMPYSQRHRSPSMVYRRKNYKA